MPSCDICLIFPGVLLGAALLALGGCPAPVTPTTPLAGHDGSEQRSVPDAGDAGMAALDGAAGPVDASVPDAAADGAAAGEGLADAAMQDAASSVDAAPTDAAVADGGPANGAKFVITSTRKLRAVFYPFRSIVPTKKSQAALDAVAEILKKKPHAKLEIEAHRETMEPEWVAEGRAESARTYLIHKGIAAERLRATSAGASKPLDSGPTAVRSGRNRRVQFKLE